MDPKNVTLFLSLSLLAAGRAQADLPVASYLFPPGAQRGTTVTLRVGGLNFHRRPSLEMLGPGVHAVGPLLPTKTVWFEGPVIPLPDSQQAEDYPKDYAVTVRVDAETPPGLRYARVWTSQGATPAQAFVIGELPELVEQEIDGDPVDVKVTLPVTINGRIFPREDVDVWSFEAKRGQATTCEVNAARLGSPLDARIEVLDPQGRPIAESDDELGADPRLHFVAPVDGMYRLKIHDINVRGAQSFVYRLTLTNAPYVDLTYPLGGRKGSSTRFELFGAGVPSGPVAIALPADGPSFVEQRWGVGERTSNAFLVAVDGLPELVEAEPNDSPTTATSVSPPVVVNGRVGRPGDTDVWAVALRAGEPVRFALTARSLGSPLDAVVTVKDQKGKEVARGEGTAKALGDPALTFSAGTDGIYFVNVSDRFRSRGGTGNGYRLKIDRPGPPDFRLNLPSDTVTLERKAEAKLKVEAERIGGFSGPIALAVEGLPPGVSAANTTIGANQTATEVVFKAAPEAVVRGVPLKIVGTAKVGDAERKRTAATRDVRGLPAVETVILAVALPTPFTVTADTDFRWAPRGTIHHRRYKIERGGYDGPIEVRLADRQARHLQGVTGPTLTVPAGESTFDYPVRLPPWMETGRTSRSVVMATATVTDGDGSRHDVSFTSSKADVQIIAVVEPGRLNVVTGLSSVAAVPGRTVSLPVRLTRGTLLDGPAQVELIAPTHIAGISARPLELGGRETEGTLVIEFGPSLPERFNAPVVIRATVMDQGDPVSAETKLGVERVIPETRLP
ncbi:MAG: hypothetical protein P4L84_21825 [Isosphaeraceae bacterium]|nr:hypothetical protein [Isosphaeraceae bacterium]